MDSDSIFSGIKYLSRGEVTGFSSTFALLLAHGVEDPDDLQTLGGILSATGDLIGTYASLDLPENNDGTKE